MFYFQLSVHYNLRNYTTLKPGKLKNYIITEKLTQFIIVNKTIEVSEDGHDFNLKIMLTRIIINHLTNTYLPTLTLLVIVEITLFFEESQLQVINQQNIATKFQFRNPILLLRTNKYIKLRL